MAEENNNKKLLSLDAIPLIKYDFLEEIAEESRLVTEAYKKAIDNKAEELWNNFKSASDEDKQTILDKLTELGNEDKTLAEGIESLKTAIQTLNNKVDGLEQPDSVLSEDEVKEIISAALVNKAFWTNDTIGAPTLIGNKIVGLIGTFGKVKAENIEGTLIEGKTVQSIPDTEGNTAWQLNNTGDGHLANGNISWDATGKVTLGSDVTIKWDNIDGKPEINDDDLVGIPGADGADGVTPLLEIREDYWYVSYDNGVTWTKLNKATGEQGPQGEQGPAGNDGKDGLPGADGKSIVSTTCEYGLSADENIEPEEWTINVPELVKGQYLWTKTTWTYNEGDPEYGYTKTYIAQDGNDGENGLPGKDGTTIVSTTFEYGLSADENTEPEEWTITVPTLVQGMYLWTKMTWTYSDETSETGYTKTYISKDGEQGPEGPQGENGLTPVIHVKYANEVVYNPDGTVNSVEWTANNGEDIGVYKGMYVDYSTDDSTEFSDYSWTMVNPEKAIATQLGAYQITSNTISGKTLQSTKNTELEVNTVFETHLEDGTFDKLIESDGTTEGPAWQLRDSGEGYLAQGNIRWDENGDVTFGEGVKIKWDNVDEKPEIPEAGLTESDVNNIISTTITKDYVESLEVRATDIIGDTITGKTINSSESISEEDTDPTWQINNDGTGYLAKKNISWDENGNLTANIDGGSLGKQDENGKCPFEWDENNVYVNKNFVFDEGVGITWDNVSGTENIASKDDIPDVSGYVTEDRVTEITDNKISTLEIDASIIKSGTIDTQRLDVDNLAVRRLNTTGATTGKRIAIEGNTISVYNSGDKVTCQLSNLSMGNLDIYDILQSSSNITINSTGTPIVSMYIPSTSYGNSQQTLSGSAVQKTSIGVLQPGATLKIGGSFKLTGVKHTGANVTCQMNYEIRIYKDNVLIETLTSSLGTSGISPTSSATISASIPETTYNITEAGTYAYASYVTGWWTPTSISSTGNMYCETKTANVVGSYDSYASDVKTTSYIYEDGAIFKNINGGFAINQDAVAMKCNNAQVVLKDGDIYMAFDGQSTPKKVVPRTYKFRLAGDTNQTLCVLTFGDVINGE